MAKRVAGGRAPTLGYLRASYFAMFFAASSFFAFVPLHYERLGFSGAQVGALVAVGPLVGLVAQPLWGHISDARQSALGVVKQNVAAAALIGLVFPWLKDFWLLGLAVGGLMFFWTPVNPLLNGVTLTVLADRPNAYGRVRLFGSIGFTTGVLVAGRILQATGTRNLFYFYSGALVVLMVVLWQIGDRPAALQTPQRRSPLELFKRPGLAALFGYIFLTHMSFSGGNAFLSIFVDALGGSETEVGVAHMIASLACMPLFYFSQNLIDRYGAKRMLMVGTLSYGLRWTLLPLVQLPWQVWIIQLLHGPGFTLTYAAAVSLVHALTPAELRSSGQTAMASLTLGMGQIVGGFTAGLVVDAVGLRWMYVVYGLTAMLTLATSPILLRKVEQGGRITRAA